jgi:hypothetical protein
VKRLALALLTLLACSKPSPQANDAAPAVSVSASASAASAPKPAPGPVTYAGTYTSAPGTLFVPDGGEWSGVKWRGDDASDGLGAGEITLTIDPVTHRADGTVEGPLGSATLAGVLEGDTLTAKISRKVATDGGESGVLLAKLSGDKLDGSIRTSSANANVIRTATVSLAKK